MGLDKKLYTEIYVINPSIGDGLFRLRIDSNAFDLYAKDTKDLCIPEYSGYNIALSVYKVLFHVKDVIPSYILLIS